MLITKNVVFKINISWLFSEFHSLELVPTYLLLLILLFYVPIFPMFFRLLVKVHVSTAYLHHG